MIYGRSDATLNPGGVRIGTAEIYRIVESLPKVDDSLVIGQEWNNDQRIILFLKLNKTLFLRNQNLFVLLKRNKRATERGKTSFAFCGHPFWSVKAALVPFPPERRLSCLACAAETRNGSS